MPQQTSAQAAPGSRARALFFLTLPSSKQPLFPRHRSGLDYGFPGTGPLCGAQWPILQETRVVSAGLQVVLGPGPPWS